MKFLLDLLPVILFFVTFKWGGQHGPVLADWMTLHLGAYTRTGSVEVAQAPILAATMVTMLASAIQMAWQKIAGRRIETMQWVTLLLVLVLGSATLFFNDERFIKWKPTAVYWLLGGALLFWQWVLKRNALQALMGSQLKLPSPVYAQLAYAWAAFFIVMGIVNLWVAFNFATDVWVNFKMFGTLGATVVFVIVQSLYLARFIDPDSGNDTPGAAPSSSTHSQAHDETPRR